MDDARQLDEFFPIKDILSLDSLILITTRDNHVLKSSGVLDSSIYHLNGLNTQVTVNKKARETSNR